MKKIPVFLCLSLMFLISCTSERDNPLDVNGDDYVPPSLTVDWINTNITQNGILTIDSLFITVTGNTPQNEFRYSLDSIFWSAWSISPIFQENRIDDGIHIIYLQTRYPSGTDIYTDSINFTAAILPATAVYISPQKQYISYGDTADIVICTKGVSATYMMHLTISGAVIIDDTILYTNNDNVNAFSSDTIIDISVLEDTCAISGSCNVISVSLANIGVTGIIGLNCVLRDKNNNTVSVDTVRGGRMVQVTVNEK
jgi:hypothetical protein